MLMSSSVQLAGSSNPLYALKNGYDGTARIEEVSSGDGCEDADKRGDVDADINEPSRAGDRSATPPDMLRPGVMLGYPEAHG